MLFYLTDRIELMTFDEPFFVAVARGLSLGMGRGPAAGPLINVSGIGVTGDRVTALR